MKTDRPLHSFTLFLDDQDQLSNELIDQLYDVCDDALIGGHDQQAYVEFDREGENFAEVVMKAIEQVEQIPGLRVRRVGPEEFVSLSAIAARLGRTPESIRLLAEGRRGPGNFPTPIAYVDAKTRLWEWSAVARWWSDVYGDDSSAAENAEFLHSLNDALDLRARSERLSTDERQAVSHIVSGAALAV